MLRPAPIRPATGPVGASTSQPWHPRSRAQALGRADSIIIFERPQACVVGWGRSRSHRRVTMSPAGHHECHRRQRPRSAPTLSPARLAWSRSSSPAVRLQALHRWARGRHGPRAIGCSTCEPRQERSCSDAIVAAMAGSRPAEPNTRSKEPCAPILAVSGERSPPHSAGDRAVRAASIWPQGRACATPGAPEGTA